MAGNVRFFRCHITFEASCRQSIAPIVAAARCLVSVMGMQRLQRIAGRRWDEWRI
ncbi:MAG: hypothetical protein WCL14_07095 [Bacteroidota bacterium]